MRYAPSLTPVYNTHTTLFQPRQSHILLAQVWHRTDIGIPRKHHISPRLVCEEWKGSSSETAPVWLCLAKRSEPYFEVQARESVVRAVVHLARERWNVHQVCEGCSTNRCD